MTITADTDTTYVEVFTCPAPASGQQYLVLEEDWDDSQDPPVRYVRRWETAGEEPAPSQPMTPATSRLHAAANTLAAWDHATGSGEDVGHEPEVMPEHWLGARQVWDAIQPKHQTEESLATLNPDALVVKIDREGAHVYRRRADGHWSPVIISSIGVAGSWLTSREVLRRHRSVRLLWQGE